MDPKNAVNGNMYFTAEPYITGEYKKYNNNDGWVVDGKRDEGVPLDTAQAFSHYTWQKSCGKVIVVDIQGACSKIFTWSKLLVPFTNSHRMNFKMVGLTRMQRFRSLLSLSPSLSTLLGVNCIFTDPQIHSLDGARFGLGNLGENGMLSFFSTHRCNPICEKLNLASFKKRSSSSRSKLLTSTTTNDNDT